MRKEEEDEDALYDVHERYSNMPIALIIIILSV